jgi:hemin uptake protein HemP
MRQNVVAQFETQLTPWEMWGNPGTKMDSARLLQPEEVEIRENGQVYFKEPK